MPKYHKPVRLLFRDMVEALGIEGGRILEKTKAVAWFSKYYPQIDRKTVEAHLTRMSVNAPSRLHYNAVKREDDLLFKLDANRFRRYDSSIDPPPIWVEEQAPSIGRRQRKQEKSYDESVAFILDNSEDLHRQFYESQTFTGPSLHFHRMAMSTRTDESSTHHLEYIYATLVAWGMHRMGPGGAKMLDFSDFERSVRKLDASIRVAENADLRALNETTWSLVEEVFRGIRVMRSSVSIVGNSKVMCHLLPNLIPPIDREYTLRFLRENIKNGIDNEWLLFSRVLRGFFIPIATEGPFVSLARRWMNNQTKYPWDTSLPKIIDNLVIAAASGVK